MPLDFISTHHYFADADLVRGVPDGPMYYRGMKGMVGDVQRVREQIAASAFPNAERHFTEWNSSPAHEDFYGKDTAFTAGFALQTIKDVSGLVDSYMWWTVSDIFEESGLSLRPFTGKYGLVNQHGIKPERRSSNQPQITQMAQIQSLRRQTENDFISQFHSLLKISNILMSMLICEILT